MKCLECGTEASGAYCPKCGTPVSGARCRRCDAGLPRGAHFCTTCGAAVRPWTAAAVIPWGIAGVAVAALILVLILPGTRADRTQASVASTPASGGASGMEAGPGPLTGTPREQADRLFNRIMQEMEAGDSARAAFFLPMALDAYGMAEPLDADGLYHLGLLQLQAGDAGAASEVAARMLRDVPDHLFGHLIAAQAAVMTGDEALARSHYQSLLNAYAAESGQQRREYLDHSRILPDYRAEASTFLAQ